MPAVEFVRYRQALEKLLSSNRQYLAKDVAGTVHVRFADAEVTPQSLDQLPSIYIKLPHRMGSPAGGLGNQRKVSIRMLVIGTVRAMQPEVHQDFVIEAALSKAGQLFANFEYIVRSNPKLDGSLPNETFISAMQEEDAEFAASIIGVGEQANAYSWRSIFLLKEMG
jgi:hypothetical protein